MELELPEFSSVVYIPIRQGVHTGNLFQITSNSWGHRRIQRVLSNLRIMHESGRGT